MVRIVIADDHPIFRDGLRRLLEDEPSYAIVGEAANGHEVVRLVQERQPDIVLLDLAMPEVSGLDALRNLAAGGHTARVIMLTASIDNADAVTAIRLGARGVVLKEAATDVLISGINRVMSGEYWVGQGGATDRSRALEPLIGGGRTVAPVSFDLTPREREIVAAVVAAFSNKDIARSLAITENTVKHHLTNIFDKLGVANRLELAMFALHHSIEFPQQTFE
jgi:DNA-binding NarL/FixJ family response regulator